MDGTAPLSCAALICLPLERVKIALRHIRLLRAESAMPKGGNPLPQPGR
jgi:hypothetical protein